MLARPDPNTFELLPGGDADAPVARMFCDISALLGRAVRRRPALRAEAQPRAGPREGLHVLRRPRDGVLLLPVRRATSSRSTTPATSTSPRTTSARELRKQTVLRLEAMGIPVEYSFHENGPSQHEIDLRYTDALDDGRQRDDVPARSPRRSRTTTACTRPSCPSRSPARSARGCTRTCRCSRATSTRSTIPGDEYGLSKVAKHFIAGLLVHASEISRDHQPVGQLLQAADPGLRGAGLQVLGAQQPLGARARAAAEEGQERVDAHRVPRARPRVQPVPRVLGDARGRAQGHRGGLRAPARGDRQHLRAHRRGAARRGHRLAARLACATRSTRWSTPSWWPRRSASTCSRTSCVNKRREWADYKADVTPFEIARYLGTL